MGIKFRCQHCQQLLNIKSRYAGKDGSCPHCDKGIRVPRQSAIKSHKKFREFTDPEATSPNSQILEDEQKTAENFGATEEFDRAQLAPASESGPIRNSDSAPATKRPKKVAKTRLGSSSVKQPSESTSLKPSRGKKSPSASKMASSKKKSKKNLSPVEKPADDNGSFLLDKPTNKWLQPDAPDPIESGMKKVWYIRHPKNGEIGPVKGKKLSKMIADNEITPRCYVWREDWEDWLRADMVFKKLEIAKSPAAEDDRVFTDPNCPIPKSYLKKVTAEDRQKKRQQILLVVAIVGGIVTIGLLAWLLATLL